MTLYFSIGACVTLSAVQRRRIRQCLATRITRDDVLYVVSSKHRTQWANRCAATEHFVELLADALRPAKPRTKTVVPTAARRRRLQEKRRRSQVKRLRGRTPDTDND